MQFSEAENASEALGTRIESSQSVVAFPDVSTELYRTDSQLSFDLKQVHLIESGTIESPTRQESIEKDFYYALRTVAEQLALDVEAQKEIILSLNTSRKKTIAQELDNIMSELNDFNGVKPVDPNQLEESIYASFDSLHGRGLSVFCSRVSYFTAIRIILIHYWKGLGFFNDLDRNPFKEPNLTINQFISKYCSNLISEKSNWLFAKQSNYSWYKISPDTLKDIESVLKHWEFNEDSIALLSYLYERYLDENRLHKYAHYTPPLLVRFIWDFLNDHCQDSSLFRWLGKNRVPKLIFDPTMGSGNFLAEAARRMTDELAKEKDPLKHLRELNMALTTGIYGCDIDIFAHFFSEVKMLWILSSLIKKSKDLNLLKKTLSLSIIHQNALKLCSENQLDMDIVPSSDQPLSTDQKFALMPMEGHLKHVHSKIKIMEKFDICIGCPPEQILKEQKDFMKEVIQKIPYWKKFYESHLLYSSWFFVLGLSKLREGGKLIYITENYWPTEDGASKLREYLLQESKIIAMIDLGKIKMAEDTTPLPRYITLLEKCSQKEIRDHHKVKMIRVHPQENPVSAAFILGKIAVKAKTIDRPGKIYTDDDIDIYFSGLNQGELDEKPWHHMSDTGFSKILKEILKFKTTLQYFCSMVENGEPSKDSPNLLTSEIGAQNHFTFHEKPEEAKNIITLTIKPICKESPHYLLALLNSPVLNFWYTHNGNKKNGKKFYDIQSLKMIPIRPISFSNPPIEASIHEEKMAQIKNAMNKLDSKYLIASLTLELTHGREEIVHDAIGLMYKEILALEKNMHRYQTFFKENIHTNSSPLKSLYMAQTFREMYPLEQQCALGEHKKVFIQKDGNVHSDQFCLSQTHRENGIKNEGDHLTLISKDNKIIKIYAPSDLLDFIDHDLKKNIHNFWDETEASIYIPTDIEKFEIFKDEIISHCESIREKIKVLKSTCHEMIFKLYGFNSQDSTPEKSKESQKAIELMTA